MRGEIKKIIKKLKKNFLGLGSGSWIIFLYNFCRREREGKKEGEIKKKKEKNE